MASRWSKPHRLDGTLKFIVPGHETMVLMQDAMMVARAIVALMYMQRHGRP
jgi:hypothetical protein